MLDEPGSFYICTETSPRCFVIQKVRAKDLPKVCDDLGVLTLDNVDSNASPRPSSDTESKNVSNVHGSNQREGQGGQGGVGGNTPPLPIFPSWWSPEAEKELEAIASVPNPCGVNGAEEETSEFGAPVTYDHQPVQPVLHQTVNVVEGYGGQQAVMHDGVVDFIVETNIDGVSRTDFHSPSAAVDQQLHVSVDQQLHVSVDQFPVTVAYPSVVSTPSNDQALASGTVEAGGPEQHAAEAARWAPPSPSTPLDISLEELKTRVRHQLEFYFSRENLAADAYLRSQMDNDQFVKVTTLASFNMVKRLTSDLNMILEAIGESPVLQLNEAGDKVRPIHKRCTLILREIPEGTRKEEVEELFSAPQCPKIVSSEIALNNIWYVNFETDEDAQKAFLYLRQKVQCFKGRPILARIKTAPIPRVQQNGSRPVPPSTLPLHNMPYPAVSPSPNLVTGASQVLLSPADSCTFVNASTPFSTASGASVAATSVDNATVVIDSTIPVPTPSPVYYYPTGNLQPIGMPIPPGPPPSGLPSAWPSPDPASFDLGYILALNGFQAQGAYRPAVFMPSTVSPACQTGTAGGNHFPGDRPPRKPRGSGYSSYHLHANDRGGAQSADSGRPPPAYSRYGPASGARSANGERRGSYWKYDQNVHYDNIRRRPSRYSYNGNYYGNGNWPNNYNGPNDGRPRYPGRCGDRQGRYGGGYDNWNHGNYQSKPRRRSPAMAAVAASSMSTFGTTVPPSAAQGKRAEDSFDLHSSSFPPLPTTTAGIPDEPEDEIEESAYQETKENLALTLEQHPTSIPARDSQEQSTIVVSPSPLVKIQPRMKGTSSTMTGTDGKGKATGDMSEMSSNPYEADGEMKRCPRADIKVDHDISFSGAAMKLGIGVTSTRSGNTLIPVAVVQPNSQQKSPKVTMADKSTTTDNSPPRVHDAGEEQCSPLKIALNECNVNQSLEELTLCDASKRLSYADMAKQGATRMTVVGHTAPPALAQKTCGTNAAVGSGGGGGTTLAKVKDQTISRRQLTEKGRGRLPTLHDSGEEDDEDHFFQHRRLRKKFNAPARNYSKPKDHGSEPKQDQVDGSACIPSQS